MYVDKTKRELQEKERVVEEMAILQLYVHSLSISEIERVCLVEATEATF